MHSSALGRGDPKSSFWKLGSGHLGWALCTGEETLNALLWRCPWEGRARAHRHPNVQRLVSSVTGDLKEFGFDESLIKL